MMRAIVGILFTVFSLSWVTPCQGDEYIMIPITRRVITTPPTPITSDGSLNAAVNTKPYFSGTLRNYPADAWNVTLPDTLPITSFASSQQESLNNYYTLVYTARISVGTPLQPFDVVFDTGSADLWVIDNAVSGHVDYMHYFDTKASVTVRTSKSAWGITYGTGHASGYQTRDTVTLLGLQAPNYLFGLCNDFTRDIFQNALEPMDGIMGLAMQSAHTLQQPTVVDALKAAGQISRKTFSFVLDPSDGGTNSLFILGDIPPQIASQYAPKGFAQVTASNLQGEAGMWFVPLQSASIGGITPFSCLATSCQALIDTGTSLITTPPSFFQQFALLVFNARSDCGVDGGRIWCTDFTYDKLPSMSVTLGGSSFVIFPADYTIVNGNRLMLGITSLQLSATQNWFILGDVFLKQHYTVFDLEYQNISIAKDYDRPRPTQPEKRITTKSTSAWLWILIIVSVVGGFIGIIFLYRYWRKRQAYLRDNQGLLNVANAAPPTNRVPLSQRTGGYRLGGTPAVPPPSSDRQQPLLSDVASESGY